MELSRCSGTELGAGHMFIEKERAVTQTQRTDLWLSKGKGVGEGINQKSEISRKANFILRIK